MPSDAGNPPEPEIIANDTFEPQGPHEDDEPQPQLHEHDKHGWKSSTVKIRLPKEGIRFDSEDDVPEFKIPGIYHRDITDVIRSVFEDEVFTTFNTTSFTQYWKVDDRDQEVFSEAYTSVEMREAYSEINSLPRDAKDHLERVVASLMMWSDSTHLTSFGDASLWPFYLFFGNESKYTRVKPTLLTCHHIAYIPKASMFLLADFQTFYMFHHDVPASAELFQAIWALLLDEKFMDAYHNGLVIQCCNGIMRRVFLHFFSYSADYPEKVLLTGIKFLGQYPCPRCLVEKSELDKMVPVDGNRIKALLGDWSYVPTINSFSDHLHDTGINFFKFFLVDLLHEFESRVWKNTFLHLLRILITAGGDTIQHLNERYNYTALLSFVLD
ncbi:hypothetical protein OG21DRAFT_1478072 [Imleria badia]|nr:hypothetical protein OG21DRAFT_1478072 [Imleria badia]